MSLFGNLRSAELAGQIGIHLHPPGASTIARDVDGLYYFLTGFTLFFTFLIFGLIFYFMIKYRRRSEDEIPPAVETSMALELTWSLIPALMCVGIFGWGATVFFKNSRPPAASMEIFVVGKQWMWQLQHPEGAREINQLHVPVNVPVKLTMTSQDVIHDFFVPAFRIKKDVLPGRYSSIWFEATQTGEYSFYCAQFCGTEHSAMIGDVFVMKPDEYANWLTENSNGQSMQQAGEKLFAQLGCEACHSGIASGKVPELAGLYEQQVKLSDGSTVVADEEFLRKMIVAPGSEPLAGFGRQMPSFQGQINEEQLLDLLAYIKSLGAQGIQAAQR